MADVVREVPQHVLAQPPHIISSFTQEEKKSMPKVSFSFYSPILIVFVKQEASSSKPFLGSMYNEVSEKPFNMNTVFFTKQLVSPTC